jgi:hypothetical protein
MSVGISVALGALLVAEGSSMSSLLDWLMARYRAMRSSAIQLMQYCNRSRWHFTAERRDGACKYNNDWTAPLARWLEQKHPKYPRFFDG